MLPRDAQDSLDTIHRLQDRSIDEYVDHSFARRYVLLSALVVFVAFASFDLPGPWNTFASALGLSLAAMVCYLWQRQARVHRKPTGLEQLYCLVAGIVFLMACVAFQIAAAVATLKFGMPAHHTVAAAAAALTFVATAGPARKAFKAVTRQAVAGAKSR